MEIKFRQKDKVKTMSRLDPVCTGLLEKLKTEMPAEKREELEYELRQREEMLNSMYHQVSKPLCTVLSKGVLSIRALFQVAVHFADLHDTPGRMMEKGVILVSPFWSPRQQCSAPSLIFVPFSHLFQDVLEWKNSRKYFYWRLRRRLCELRAIDMIKKADGWVGHCRSHDLTQGRNWPRT